MVDVPGQGQGPIDPRKSLPQQKFQLNDLMDVENVQNQLSTVFSSTFANISKSIEKDFMLAFDKVFNKQSTALEKLKAKQKTLIEAMLSKELDAVDTKYQASLRALQQLELTENQKRQRQMALDEQYYQEVEALEKKAHAKQKQQQASERAAAVLSKTGQMAGSLGMGALGAIGLGGIGSIAGVLGFLADAVIGLSKAQATTAAQMRGAGMFTAGPGQASSLTSKLFGAIPPSLATPQQLLRLTGQLAQAPKLFNETVRDGSHDLVAFMKASANMGVSLQDSMSIATNASNAFGLSQKDLSKVMITAIGITNTHKIALKDALNMTLRMAETMRGLSFDINVSKNVIDAFSVSSSTLAKMAPEELQKFAQNLGESLGNMSMSKLIGFAGVANGGRLPRTMGELDQATQDPINMISRIFRPLLHRLAPTGEATPMALGAIEQISQQIGFGRGTTRMGAQALFDIMTGQRAGADTSKIRKNLMAETPEEKAARQFQMFQRQGFENLAHINGPLEAIKNSVDRMVIFMMGPLTKYIFQVTSAITYWQDTTQRIKTAAPQVAMNAVEGALNPASEYNPIGASARLLAKGVHNLVQHSAPPSAKTKQ